MSNIKRLNERDGVAKLDIQIEELIDDYNLKLTDHPITKLCFERSLPKNLLGQFARAQLVDNSYWVPMLSLIRDRADCAELKSAIGRNIEDEVGLHRVSHVSLCHRFVESMGEPTRYSAFGDYSPASVYPVTVMMNLAGKCDEAFMAGWLYAQERLVPEVFRIFRFAIQGLDGVDVTYLTEHEEVDGSCHAKWLMGAIDKVVTKPSVAERVITGVDFGGRAVLAVPDFLYSEFILSVDE